MITYCKGEPGELPAIMDFINMVFSMHQHPHNFQTLLPKLYGPGRETEAFHYLAKEDSKIIAVICVLPIMLKYQNHTITCGTVGSVSVHPYSRGNGHMKSLMSIALEDMKKNHFTMSVLAGRRHRYQYYGYEPGGQLLEYQFIPDNFRHCSSPYTSYPITLVPTTAVDTPLLWELQQSQTLHTNRSFENFLTIGHSWNCSIYTIFHCEEICGYLCACDQHIYELVLKKENYLCSVLSTYMMQKNCQNLKLSVAPHHTERIETLFRLYERWSILEEDNYRIFDYKEAISFYLKIKASTEPLTQASLTLKLGEAPPLLIEVSGQEFTVAETCKTADLSLNDIEAIDILFSSNAYYMKNLYPALSSINWFPLPLSIPHMDKC